MDGTPLDRISVDVAGRQVRFAGDPSEDYFRRLPEFFNALPGLEPFVREHVPEDGVCLDVGANIGLTAVLLATLCPRGHVWAFEAIPRNAALMRATLAENSIKNVTVMNQAIGAEPGELSFTDRGVGSHAVTDAHLAPPRDLVRVPVVTLDAALAHLDRLDFVKMDIEGFEPAALAGARTLMERFRPPMTMEFNSWVLSVAHGFSPFAFASALVEHFEVQEVQDDGTVRPISDPVQLVHDNLLLKHSVSDVMLRLRPDMGMPSLARMTETPKEADLRRRLSTLEKDLKEAEARVQALEASTSWRVTAPLRAIRSRLGGQ